MVFGVHVRFLLCRVSVNTFHIIFPAYVCNRVSGYILDSNWVSCYCSIQHLGLFFLSLTLFCVHQLDPDPAL